MMKKRVFGCSIYVSSFEKQKTFLKQFSGKNRYVFTSFHIAEEFGEDYIQRTKVMMSWLKNQGFKVVADVSDRTLKAFDCDDLETFKNSYDIDVVRIDYGFDSDRIQTLSQQMKIMVNASTIEKDLLEKINGHSVVAGHNFYPRPETGLGRETFDKINQMIKPYGLDVAAFIPDEKDRRRPIYEGLPTLEAHRNQLPYISALELYITHDVDQVYLGDLSMDSKILEMILRYVDDDVISIPCQLNDDHQGLYNQVFTVRIDSGAYAFRIHESRAYASSNHKDIIADNTKSRPRGSITMDNVHYKRYAGEIQIVHRDLLADERVNVIGQVLDPYQPILSLIDGGSKIMFISDQTDY